MFLFCFLNSHIEIIIFLSLPSVRPNLYCFGVILLVHLLFTFCLDSVSEEKDPFVAVISCLSRNPTGFSL